jgi:CRISPR-associated endonuclease/helicase Cas3
VVKRLAGATEAACCGRLIACGHVRFEAADRFGDQFAVLLSRELYSDETGLLWEDAEYLALEGIL